jgi:hypothetical protein
MNTMVSGRWLYVHNTIFNLFKTHVLENLLNQVKTLKMLVGILTIIVLITAAACIYLLQRDGHFKEITAERINIAEQDGKLRMVISNQKRQHPGMFDNKLMTPRDRPAGMIFFNDAGDECGGFVYDGDKKSAGMTLSVDQFKNDQIMQLQYQQENKNGQLSRSYGMKLWDRRDDYTLPWLIAYTDSLKKLNDAAIYNAGIQKLETAGVLEKERLFVGKNTAGEVGLFLRDAKGIPRLNIFIDAQNRPVIQTLNDKGEVIK